MLYVNSLSYLINLRGKLSHFPFLEGPQTSRYLFSPFPHLESRASCTLVFSVKVYDIWLTSLCELYRLILKVRRRVYYDDINVQ